MEDKPNYNFNVVDEYNGVLDSRYFVPQYSLSAPTSIQTPNQIAEATARLNAGVTGVDLALIYADIFEQVPREHFKEISRLMKLTGAKASIHGPIERGVTDLAGFREGRWDEVERKDTERKIKYFIDRAHDLDEEGNTPINFHINTNIPGEHWRKLSDEELQKLKSQAKNLDENERKSVQGFIDRGEVMERLGILDQETGQVQSIPYEVKHYPGGDEIFTPQRRLKSLNRNQWDDDKLKIFEYQRQKALIEERKDGLNLRASPLAWGVRQGKKLTGEEEYKLREYATQLKILEAHEKELDTHIHSSLNELHHKLSYLPEKYKPKAEAFMKDVEKSYKQYDEQLEKVQHDYAKVKSDEERAKLAQIAEAIRERQYKDLQIKLESVGNERALGDEKGLPLPQRFIPTNQIAKEKTVETVSNSIYDSYKKYKENTPIITIENYWYNRTLGSASELEGVIKQSREKFADKLVKNEGMSREKARETAEKLIGVTWDVGHINMMRSGGYDEKEILKETREIAPYVKQLHITDNFGFNDSHLPPGMGNAPINKEIEELKKRGFKFEKGNVIVEAGAWPSQFGENPHPYALEYFNTPLYTMKAQPNWYNIWETQGPYSLGYGDILPDIHFRELYGGGFSNLPVELGGQRGASDRGRFATSSQ